MDPSAVPRVTHVLPSQEELHHARSKLLDGLPEKGLGYDHVKHHIESDLVPAFSRSSKSAHYYGFVTGGTTPAAVLGEVVAVENDQFVQVHLPKESISTEVEDRALRMVCDLLDLNSDGFPHRTFTTGATGSNIVGLVCTTYRLRSLTGNL